MHVLVDSNTILSGLFFRGNERRLLRASLRGRLTLIIPEHVHREVLGVISRKFQNKAALPGALSLLTRVIDRADVAQESDYRPRLAEAAKMVRDTDDVPVIAAALHLRPDRIVSGDKDLLALSDRLPVVRTRELLKSLRSTTRRGRKPDDAAE